MEGEGILHRTVELNGIKMHVAEKGEGPVVLFIHGFPELWYTWRHQISHLVTRGYRSVAPDLRGYGDTYAPPSTASYTIFHIVGDLVALIDNLGEEKVFVVGTNWGAVVAWSLCTFRPDKVKALVNMRVAFSPRDPKQKPVDSFRALYGEDHYICRFQEPRVMEAEFARMDMSSLLKQFFAYREPKALLISKDGGLASDPTPIALPSWLSKKDVDYFAKKFSKSGFTGGLNYYRNLDLNWELMAPWIGIQIEVPVKFIVGDLDLTYHIPGAQDYIHNGGFKRDVPFLEDVVVMEGAGNFINQERPSEISNHIYEFIRKF